MGISLKTHKMLWGRSGGRCSIPNCRKLLVVDETETDDPSLIGEEAHIVAREPNDPRGKSPLSPEKRDKYNNLILLCRNHHKIVDDQENEYTVERLHEIKNNHIEWFKKTAEYDEKKQLDDEIYATYIEKWGQLCNLNTWNNWSSFVLGSGQPKMLTLTYKQLQKLIEYILSRIWPHRYKELESSFTNFRLVLSDLFNTFSKYMIQTGEWFLTEKFYKIREHDNKRYHELSQKYDYHVDLVEDLMLELTRVANYLCDQARKSISPSFRLKEGSLLVSSGPYMDLTVVTMRVEYRNEERTEYPYPGLEKFMTLRKSRDKHFGEGFNPDYFPPSDLLG